MEVLHRLDGAHRVESFLQVTCIEADRAAIVAGWNSGGRPDMKYVKSQMVTYIEYKCSHTVQYLSCYTIMMH